MLRIIGRLRNGKTLSGAAGEMKTVSLRHRRAFAARQLQIIPLQRQLSGDVRPTLVRLLGAVIVILLITCSNLAGIQLARTLARSSEMTTRLALGSSRFRIVQLLVSESTLLAGTGGILGVTGAYVALPAVRTIDFLHLALPKDLNLDVHVLVAALLLTFSCALALVSPPGLRQ